MIDSTVAAARREANEWEIRTHTMGVLFPNADRVEKYERMLEKKFRKRLPHNGKKATPVEVASSTQKSGPKKFGRFHS
jgi:hypothetical protein